MKYSIIFALMSFVFLSSCRHEEGVAALLLRAESCMESHPDSALSLLNQLVAPQHLQEHQQADYALLMTQAMCKNVLPITSDSLITVVLHYYQNSNNTLRKGQSYYYWGAVCEEKGDTDAAFDGYLHAKEALQGSENFKMLGLVNASMGRIYYEKRLYQPSIDHRKLAISFFLRLNDSLSVSISARAIGHSYLLLNKLDSADLYLDGAFQFATTDERRIEIQGDKFIVYREQGASQNNADMFLKIINLPGRSDEQRACSYLTLGNFYLKQKERVKAQDCFLKSKEMGSLDTQAAALNSLYRIKKEEGNYADALAYHESFLSLFDSIAQIQNAKEIVALQLKYDKESVEQKLSLKHLQLWLSFSLLSLLVLLLLFLWRYYLVYRKRKESELVRMERLMEKTQAEISDYRSKLAVTEKQLDARELDKEELLMEKRHIEEVLRQKVAVVTNLIKEKKQMTSVVNQFKLLQAHEPVLKEDCRLIEASHLYEALISSPQKTNCYTSDNWELLYFWTDITCRKFCSRLEETHPTLKKRDLQICCLIKLGFSNDDIRMIFDIQQGTLYTDKNNTKRRLGLKEGVKLEHWLSSF